jgi:poly-gamma-glutamate capsule biosynthesis protein CapA/YwtB (metallophosphatase superfamily)
MDLFLSGDVMTGRGVDQILPRPGDPQLWEQDVRDARTYLELAEVANGAIDRPVSPSWPWGDALQVLEQTDSDVRLINLETSVTQSDRAAPGKAVHYRMHPANIGCLTVARPDACVLANNHVLDFGGPGLTDTLDTLAEAGIRGVGAGQDLSQAERPAVLSPPGGGRVIVFAGGTRSSGITPDWAATPERGGVNLLPDLSDGTADQIGERVRRAKQPGDIAVFSVHWGSNWGYEVPAEQVAFAHRLIDHGVDLIHGHSSHHPRPIEIYRGKLILYGAGDFIDDYEGIGGHEDYRDDLRAMYFPTIAAESGRVLRLAIVPMQARRMRLHRVSIQDSRYLCDLLDRISTPFGARFQRDGDLLEIGWRP